jgi:hypothetical protein
MSNPSLPEILSAGPYAEGVWVNDWNGINGPNIGSKNWTPQAGKPFSGEPPTSSMGVGLGAFDFIQKAYMVPPYHDESNEMIMPEQLCFTVNYADATTGSVVVMTLPKVNQTLHEEWLHLERSKTVGNPEYNPQSARFYGYLQKFGEKYLNAYERASSEGRLDELKKRMTDFDELMEFRRLATEDDYHWLTLFGLLRHITFAGVVINTNRAVGLETMDRTRFTDHYTVVNVCLAKRIAVANVFGSLAHIKTGSKVWLILKRKNKPNGDAGELMVVPGGSHINDYPLAGDLEFNDVQEGAVVRGHFWRVGVVLRQSDTSPAEISVQRAANTGHYCNERSAYEAHGTLPTMWVALGFKY